MQHIRRIAQEVGASLTLSQWMGNLYVEQAATPWDEKVRLKKKKDYFEVRLAVWQNEAYLYGRVYRPHGTLEPKSRENYHHIWSIFVDSRLEQRGIDNFFDRTLRRNMFVDAQKHVPWTVSLLFFEKLWAREHLKHPEIVDLSHNLDKIMSPGGWTGLEAFELEISKSVTDHSPRSHIERMPSEKWQRELSVL
jgi:hypothetical protein